MKSKFIYLRACISLVFATLTLLTFAQTQDDNKMLPQGKWTLEKFRAFKANDPTPISTIDINAKICNEVKITQDSIFFISNENTLRGTYLFNETSGICFAVSSAAFTGGYLFQNKLFVQQKIENPFDVSDSIYVSYTYKHK